MGFVLRPTGTLFLKAGVVINSVVIFELVFALITFPVVV
jgi:hypothetical protein